MKKLFGIILGLLISIPAIAYMGSSFDEPIQVCSAHILVKDQMQALRLKSEIKNYEDFQELAKIYSECPSGRNGGYLGCFGRKQMVKEFEKAFKKAIKHKGPYIIDTIIDMDEFVLPMLPPGGSIEDIITSKEEATK